MLLNKQFNQLNKTHPEILRADAVVGTFLNSLQLLEFCLSITSLKYLSREHDLEDASN